jgi:hypothetical protein
MYSIWSRILEDEIKNLNINKSFLSSHPDQAINKNRRAKFTKILLILFLLAGISWLIVSEYNYRKNLYINELRVNSYTKGEQKNPAVGIDNDNIFITWQSENQDGDKWGIYGKIFETEEKDMGKEILINQTIKGEQLNPSVAAQNGLFIVAWNGAGNGDNEGIFSRIYKYNGEPYSDEIMVNDDTSGPQVEPFVLIYPDESLCIYYIIWKNPKNNTISLKKNIELLPQNQYNEGDEVQIKIPEEIDFRTIRFGLSGNKKILLLGKQNEAIYLYKIDPENELITDELLVSKNGNNPSINSGAGDKTIISWEDLDIEKNMFQLKAKMFDKNLKEEKGSPFIIRESKTERFIEPSSYFLDKEIVSIWESRDKAWENGITLGYLDDILKSFGIRKDLGLKTDKNAKEYGDSLMQINDYGSGNQINYSVGYFTNASKDLNLNHLVVAWESYGQDGDKNGIYTDGLVDYLEIFIVRYL